MSASVHRIRAVGRIRAVRDGADFDNRTYFTLIGLKAGASQRIVLSFQACGQPFVPGLPYVFTPNSSKVKFDTNSLGQRRIEIDQTTPLLYQGLSGDWNRDGDVDGADFLAWRIKRASGQSVGCYEVDARLSRNQS